MANGELREAPKGLLPPEQKIEAEKGREQEKTPEQNPASALETPSAEKQPAGAATANVAVLAPAAPKDPELMKVERILEENLGDVFFSLTPEQRARFKAKGEETALTLRQMVESAKVNARKVLQLIRAWLKLIPGVNKYFLEQEAKIKTDKIMLLSEEKKKEKELQV